MLSPQGVCELAACTEQELQLLVPSWNDLPPDHQRTGGVIGAVAIPASSSATTRWRWLRIAPIGNRSPTTPCMAECSAGLNRYSRRYWHYRAGGMPCCAGPVPWPPLRGAQPWYAEAHQFRIDTTDGIGRPTPEGGHRDGVDLVAVFLVARNDVKGGETRVFEADGPNGRRFTLTQPWSVLLLDDARWIHEPPPIQPDGENLVSRHLGADASRKRISGRQWFDLT